MKAALKLIGQVLVTLSMLTAASLGTAAQQEQNQAAPVQPAVDQWSDEFEGTSLDESKWEAYTFDGGGGGKVEVKENQLRMRGTGSSRSGIRSRQSFQGERFFVEAALAKVGTRNPEPGERSFPPGFAIISVLFDGNPMNRIEWLLRSDGIFEAWVSTDGRMERVDNGKLATKEKSPKMGIARRGQQVFFMLNREVGLERTVRGMSQNFKVMLYGYGSSENNWDSVVVQTLK